MRAPHTQPPHLLLRRARPGLPICQHSSTGRISWPSASRLASKNGRPYAVAVAEQAKYMQLGGDAGLKTAEASSWTPAVFIAACALTFTAASFWWLNARRGKLRSYEPHSFAGVFRPPILLILRFPLVLHNTGPTPLVVQNLRLRFPDENLPLPIPWRSSRAQLKPDDKDGHQLPSSFPTLGRNAETHHIEFGGPFPGLTLSARDYRAVIEVKLGHRKQWVELVDFTLRLGHVTDPVHYITYSNAPHDLTKEDLASAEVKLRQVMGHTEETPLQTNDEKDLPSSANGP